MRGISNRKFQLPKANKKLSLPSSWKFQKLHYFIWKIEDFFRWNSTTMWKLFRANLNLNFFNSTSKLLLRRRVKFLTWQFLWRSRALHSTVFILCMNIFHWTIRSHFSRVSLDTCDSPDSTSPFSNDEGSTERYWWWSRHCVLSWWSCGCPGTWAGKTNQLILMSMNSIDQSTWWSPDSAHE